MSPKSGRCPNAGTNVPWEVMEHVDCTGMTDRPGLKPINEALKTA